ncbi:hypothetical protein [Raoultella sp. BIGb0149]|uniref:hypothetical protein n=1 Tax=Raoultella sp. BIGb0149 TaxID=2485116 RepID=UPI00105D7BB3|nr:hypothetical protein [Raoultella sp. BIGb0149]
MQLALSVPIWQAGKGFQCGYYLTRSRFKVHVDDDFQGGCPVRNLTRIDQAKKSCRDNGIYYAGNDLCCKKIVPPLF